MKWPTIQLSSIAAFSPVSCALLSSMGNQSNVLKGSFLLPNILRRRQGRLSIYPPSSGLANRGGDGERMGAPVDSFGTSGQHAATSVIVHHVRSTTQREQLRLQSNASAPPGSMTSLPVDPYVVLSHHVSCSITSWLFRSEKKRVDISCFCS